MLSNQGEWTYLRLVRDGVYILKGVRVGEPDGWQSQLLLGVREMQVIGLN